MQQGCLQPVEEPIYCGMPLVMSLYMEKAGSKRGACVDRGVYGGECNWVCDLYFVGQYLFRRHFNCSLWNDLVDSGFGTRLA